MVAMELFAVGVVVVVIFAMRAVVVVMMMFFGVRVVVVEVMVFFGGQVHDHTLRCACKSSRAV